MVYRALTAIGLALALGGPALAHASQGGYGGDNGLLAELPAHAPPGECYARVRIPGEPAGPPPMVRGARWEQTPGPPGSPGPVWCLVPTIAVAAPLPPAPDRFGWIRVLCDSDATPARIGRLQRELHEQGDYRGEFTGRYDARTAEAVSSFQTRRHIRHGGYLSLETLQALDDGPAYGEQAYASSAHAWDDRRPPAYAPPPPSGCSQACAGLSQGAASSYGYQSYSEQTYGYGSQAYGPGAAAGAYAGRGYLGVKGGWLTWGGKSRF